MFSRLRGAIHLVFSFVVFSCVEKHTFKTRVVIQVVISRMRVVIPVVISRLVTQLLRLIVCSVVEKHTFNTKRYDSSCVFTSERCDSCCLFLSHVVFSCLMFSFVEKHKCNI